MRGENETRSATLVNRRKSANLLVALIIVQRLVTIWKIDTSKKKDDARFKQFSFCKLISIFLKFQHLSRPAGRGKEDRGSEANQQLYNRVLGTPQEVLHSLINRTSLRDWRGTDGEPGEAAVKRGAQSEVGDDDATVRTIRLLEGGDLLVELQGRGYKVAIRPKSNLLCMT